jgi:LCP family protein required for cell wall assembly
VGCAAVVVTAGLGFSAGLIWPIPSNEAQGDDLEFSDSSNQIATFLTQGLVPYRLSRPVHLLVMGIDLVPGTTPGTPESFAGRSDTLLLARVDPMQEAVNVLSIPRDTQVEIPGYGFTKINHANWFGGPALAKEVVEYNFNDLPVDRYLRVNTGAFRAIIDLVGGVRVFVPQDMYYVDQTQGLTIDLKEGWQILNGDQAEQFARFRNDVHGDIGRVQRQQILFKALRQKLLSPGMVVKLPELLEVFQDYVDTNLSFEEMVALAGFGLQVEKDAIQMVMLPGRPSELGEFAASYWMMDESARDRLLTDHFAQPALVASSEFTHVADIPEQLQPHIAIQNATDQWGQAYDVAEYLRDLGFWHVYVVPDWPDTIATSQIIAQRGDIKAAENLQTLLQLGEIEASSTGDLESDLTLRLGQDSLELLQLDLPYPELN